MEKALYEEGYEFPEEHNLTEDPLFIEFYKKQERWIESGETTPEHKREAEMIIAILNNLEIREGQVEDLEYELEQVNDENAVYRKKERFKYWGV